MSGKRTTFFIAGLTALLPLHAQDLTVETYTPPQIADTVPPFYPGTALQTGQEAWVELNFMVDKEGKPFELMVTESTGSERFSESALNAVQKWTYEPARRGGEPIVGSVTTRISFMLGGATGARSAFANRYRVFARTMEDGNEEEIKSALDRLVQSGARNHYENAYLGYARFMYAQKFEDPLTQMRHLLAALSYTREPDQKVYLPDEQARYARIELLRAQVLNNYLAEALQTYSYFEKKGDEEIVELFKPAIGSIKALEHSGPAYAIPLTLSPAGSSYVMLLKHKVYVQNVVGKVAEFKLRCTEHYIGFAAEPDVSYDVPDEWGDCTLEIIGDAGTTLELVQHSDPV